MKLLLDLLVLLVLGYCGYTGYKRGIVSTALGAVAMLLSVYIAFLLANTYSSEFVGLVRPFAAGLVDSAITDTLEYNYNALPSDSSGTGDTSQDSMNSSDKSSKIKILLPPVMQLTDEDKEDPYTVTLAAFQRLGIQEDAAARMGKRVAAETTSVGQKFIDLATEEFSLTVCKVAIFGLGFILVAIIFVVIGNVLSFDFGLPGLEKVNNTAGAAIGIVKGIIILMVIACILRYLGLIIGSDKMGSALFFRLFYNVNVIAAQLGI